MKCEIDECDEQAAGIRLFEARTDGTLRHPLVCEHHAQAIVAQYTRQCVDIKHLSGSSAMFTLTCIATCDTSELALVFLSAREGSCYYFTMSRIEGRMLANLLVRRAKANRVSTHQVLLAIIKGMGGTIREIGIEEVAGNEYRAIVGVDQLGRILSFEMRASDGLALAMAASTGVLIARPTLERSGSRAAQSAVLHWK